MSQAPKQIVLKPSSEPEGEASSAANDLSASELDLLHKGLAALREMDAGAEGFVEEERKSVRALIAHAACDLGINEEVVEAQVKRHFELSDTDTLHSGQYDDLVQFLNNLDIKQFIN